MNTKRTPPGTNGTRRMRRFVVGCVPEVPDRVVTPDPTVLLDALALEGGA